MSVSASFRRSFRPLQTSRQKARPGSTTARVNGGFAVDAVLEINGEWQVKQDIAGETDPNSGGNVVFLSPGVRLTSNAWSGFVSFGLPIVNGLNGEQSEPEYRLVGGIAVGF